MSASDFIPFHLPSIGEEEIAEVTAALRSGCLTTGAKTAQFEEEFCRAMGARYAVAVNSGSSGLHLALVALGIGYGDEVITSPLTFCATVNAILHTGARPVLADIGEDGNLDPKCITRRLTRRTKAIIPVHLAGASCDMGAIWELARTRKLKVIEDAAHACGSAYKDRPIGSSYGVSASAAVAFSFGATQNLTTGEGGMLVTASEELALRMRMLARHGISRDAWQRYSEKGEWDYDVLESGFNYNLCDIQASIGIHQLRKLARFQAAREWLAQIYNREFADIPEIELPPPSRHGTHSWHLYIIRLRLERLRIDRAEFIRQLRERNIGATVHFKPIQNHSFFAPFAPDNPCPRAIQLYPRLISLPLYPVLTEGSVRRVADAVKTIIERNKTTAREYLQANA